MDPVGFALGVVSAVIQTYNAAMSAYDLYLGVTDFSSAYEEIRMGLMIERTRLDLWGAHVLSAYQDSQVAISPREHGIWRLFKMIFDKIQESLREIHTTMDDVGQRTSLPTQGDALGEISINVNFSSRFLTLFRLRTDRKSFSCR